MRGSFVLLVSFFYAELGGCQKKTDGRTIALSAALFGSLLLELRTLLGRIRQPLV